MTKDKSETGAHRALTDTARMRGVTLTEAGRLVPNMPVYSSDLPEGTVIVDPLEQTQPMPVAQRRYRQFEARVRRAGISSPVDTHDFRDGSRDWFTDVTYNGCRDES